MTIHSGLDLVAIATHGVYSETYGAGAASQENICNLYASWGFLESIAATTHRKLRRYIRMVLRV